MFFCNGVDFLHRGALAVEMHRHDGLCARRDGGLDAGGVDVIACKRGLDQHGGRPGVADGQHRRNKGVGGGDDLIARADAHRLEDQHQRVQSVAAADAVPDAAVGGKCLFKGGILAAADVPAVVQHAGKRPAQLGIQLPLHRAERDKRHRDRDLGHRVTPHFKQQIYRRGAFHIHPCSLRQRCRRIWHPPRTAPAPPRLPRKRAYTTYYIVLLYNKMYPFATQKRAPPKISGAPGNTLVYSLFSFGARVAHSGPQLHSSMLTWSAQQQRPSR